MPKRRAATNSGSSSRRARAAHYEFNMDDLGDLFGGLGGMFRQARERDRVRCAVRISSRSWTSISSTPCAAFRPSMTLQRPVACDTCHGSGTKPGTTPTTCPECQGTGSKSVSQGPMQFRRTCPRCMGSGQLPGDPCVACRGAGRVRAAGDDSRQYPARRRAWKTDSPARQRRGGCSRRAGGRPIHYAAYSAAPVSHALRRDISMELPITVGEAVRGATSKCRRRADRSKSKFRRARRAASSCASEARESPRTAKARPAIYICGLWFACPRKKLRTTSIDKIDQAYGEDVRKDVRM